MVSVVVAPDSFKGTASAAVVASAMARGVRSVLGPSADVREIPMADGGEGTLDAVLTALGGAVRTAAVHDALGRPRTGRYGLAGPTAVVETAEGTGLPHVSDRPLRPLRADSRGAGELVRAALDDGADEILLGLGGSASTDGGTGLLAALGARFLDADGAPVPPGGGGLSRVASVDLTRLHPRARQVRWRVAVDVDNPLLGPRGAARVFAPQKGACPAEVELLERGLAHLTRVLDADDLARSSGCGAAGGLPLTLSALLGARTEPGSALVANAVGLPAALADADLVLTGEGCLDEQSLSGKVVAAVRALTPPGRAVVVVAGRVELSPAQVRAAGLTAALSIGPVDLAELAARTPELVEATAAHACTLVHHLGDGDGDRGQA